MGGVWVMWGEGLGGDQLVGGGGGGEGGRVLTVSLW